MMVSVNLRLSYHATIIFVEGLKKYHCGVLILWAYYCEPIIVALLGHYRDIDVPLLWPA